jgi:hypothetical protein
MVQRHTRSTVFRLLTECDGRYNNRDDCETAGFTWYEISLSDYINVSYPECRLTGFARVNHLGNTFDTTVSKSFEKLGEPAGLNANRFDRRCLPSELLTPIYRYMWQIPKFPKVKTRPRLPSNP